MLTLFHLGATERRRQRIQTEKGQERGRDGGREIKDTEGGREMMVDRDTDKQRETLREIHTESRWREERKGSLE